MARQRRLQRTATVGAIAVLAFVLPLASSAKPPAVESRVLDLTDLADAGAEGRAVTRRIELPIPANLLAFSWNEKKASEVELRVGDSGGWQPWMDVDANPDEGPDPGSREHRDRTSTAPIWIGSDVSAVEVKAPHTRLRGFTMHMIHSAPDSAFAPPSARAAVAQPGIISRAEWGADESLRNCSPSYADVIKFSVVHHTATRTSYSPSDVPAIIRGIYHYHTQSNGWCDLGYNFIVDRYGRIFEGRHGGVDKPVIGAHAGGFNTRSFGVAVLGTFSSDTPPSEAISAVSRLTAWKFDIYGIEPQGQVQVVSGGSTRYPAGTTVTLSTLIGHRDVSATACPGDRLYAYPPSIRDAAAQIIAAERPEARILVVPTGSSTTVSEGDYTDAYDVVLDSQPASIVNVSVRRDGQVEVTPSSLAFTPSNWSTPQRVTITAVDDRVIEESTHYSFVSHSVLSSDSAFNSIATPSIVVSVRDKDPALLWESLGGALTSGPDAASSGSWQLDAYVRGNDDQLWHRSFNPSTGWQAWQPLGGVLTSDPSAVSWGPDHRAVFVRGTDNSLWYRMFEGGSWSAWRSLGGVLTSGPDAASAGTGHLAVFVRGNDNQLWHRVYQAGSWGRWQSLGGVLTSDPSTTSWGSGRLDVFVRGNDNQLWHRSFDGISWQNWAGLGGVLTSAPDASSWPGRIDVFVRGMDNAIWQRTLALSWLSWSSIGGYGTSAPSAVSWGSDRIDVFVRGQKGDLKHTWFTNGAWAY